MNSSFQKNICWLYKIPEFLRSLTPYISLNYQVNKKKKRQKLQFVSGTGLHDTSLKILLQVCRR